MTVARSLPVSPSHGELEALTSRPSGKATTVATLGFLPETYGAGRRLGSRRNVPDYILSLPLSSNGADFWLPL